MIACCFLRRAAATLRAAVMLLALAPAPAHAQVVLVQAVVDGNQKTCVASNDLARLGATCIDDASCGSGGQCRLTAAEYISAGTRDLPVFGDPAYFWFSRGRCLGSGEHPGLPDAPARISRIAGFSSPIRRLVEVPQVPGACSTEVYRLYSNISADATHLYFFDSRIPGYSALQRLPRDASPAAPAYQTLEAYDVAFQRDEPYPHEVEVGGPDVYYVFRSPGFSILYRGGKTGASGDPVEIYGGASEIRDLQWDGYYLWFLSGSTLTRYDPASGHFDTFDSGVDGYLAEGAFYDDWEGQVFAFVTYGRGRELVNLEATTRDYDVWYTSPDTSARIYAIARTATQFFFFEERLVGDPFGTRRHYLFRRPAGSGSTTDLIYDPGIRNQRFKDFGTDHTFLYWQDPGSFATVQSLFRLSVDAAAIPTTNLRATALEVVQSVGNRQGDVPLIAGKRTFVRFAVEADGADVPDVQARLTVYRNGVGTALQPSIGATTLGGGTVQNAPTPRIRVKDIPDRLTLADSFTFELPSYLTEGALGLVATVNPGDSKPESGPGASDNTIVRSPVVFEPSPRMNLGLVLIDYQLRGTLYQAQQAHVDAALAFLRRIFPISSSAGDLDVPGDGLRVRQLRIRDDSIATRVDRSAPECAKLGADANMCAGQYAQAIANGLQARGLLPAFPLLAYRYELIPQTGAANEGTRGFAIGTCDPGNLGGSGAGPIGAPTNNTLLTYTAHEIGHMVGRHHPASGLSCGHDAADPGYPYASATIGTGAVADDAQVYGLDAGDIAANIPFSLIRYFQRFDVMSYCHPGWISDYTFRGMYACFEQAGVLGGGAAALRGMEAPPAPLSGDFLLAAGWVSDDGAALPELRRLEEAVPPPASSGGPFALRLVGDGGAVLATHPFTPEPVADSTTGLGTVSMVVPWVAGTRSVRIVELANGATLFTKSVSATAPVVSGVALVDAPNPVSGVVTLTWSASDPEGALHFDLLYSSDGGATFAPVRLGVTGGSAQIDTGELAGGTGVFRVVASDGVLTAQADSAPFAMAAKAPRVRILSPTGGSTIAWGTIVNLSAEAIDLQEGGLSGDAIEWRNQYGLLGTGDQLSVADLPIGVNAIEARVTNGAGATGSASVSITVADELGATAPTLFVEPAQIGLNAAAGATGLLTTELRISNPGAGGLSYQVATDGTPWLRVAGGASASGDAPATVAVSADPTGLASGASHSAALIVTPNGASQQARTVPVTLAVGSVWENGGLVPEPGTGAAGLVASMALLALARLRARGARRQYEAGS